MKIGIKLISDWNHMETIFRFFQIMYGMDIDPNKECDIEKCTVIEDDSLVPSISIFVLGLGISILFIADN